MFLSYTWSVEGSLGRIAGESRGIVALIEEEVMQKHQLRFRKHIAAVRPYGEGGGAGRLVVVRAAIP
jgi:hypothetical protein